MDTRLLNTGTVEDCASIEAVIDAVESAFAADARGQTIMPAKSYIDLPHYNGDFRSMPAYLDTGEWDAAGIKWVNVHPDNPREHTLPTVLGVMIYSDPETAFPLAIMDGTVLTRLRTGAAAAVATDYLAIETASTLGIVGAGAQAGTQLEAIASVRPIETVIIADRNPERQEAFVEKYEDRFEVTPGTIEAAAGCDVLSTVTPVEDPIIDRAAVSEPTHINAIGADAAGKHELTDELLLDARIVIDDYEQCTHSGEINVPWGKGVLTDDDLHGELGSVVIGEIAGREPTTGITIFDSTGLAIQDVAAAHVTYEAATKADRGDILSLIDISLR